MVHIRLVHQLPLIAFIVQPHYSTVSFPAIFSKHNGQYHRLGAFNTILWSNMDTLWIDFMGTPLISLRLISVSYTQHQNIEIPVLNDLASIDPTDSKHLRDLNWVKNTTSSTTICDFDSHSPSWIHHFEFCKTNFRFVISDYRNPVMPNLTYFRSHSLSIMHYFRKKYFASS